MSTVVLAIARLTVLELVRNRLIWLAVAAVLLALGIADFMANVALSETSRFQSAILGATLRASAVFIVSLFVVTSMNREIADKSFEMLISLPVPRGAYLVGKLLGFGTAATTLAILFGVAGLVHAPVDQVVIWTASLAAELWLVMALSVLTVLTFAQVPAAVASALAFYVFARSVAALQLMGHGPMNSASATPLFDFATWGMDAAEWVLPELHTFTRTDWLVYHSASWSDLGPILGQTVIYFILLAVAAAFDLYRKNL